MSTPRRKDISISHQLLEGRTTQLPKTLFRGSKCLQNLSKVSEMTFQKNMKYGAKWPFLIFKEEFQNLSIPAGVYKVKPKFESKVCLPHDFKGCADRI
jgi:hypothetical protein